MLECKGDVERCLIVGNNLIYVVKNSTSLHIPRVIFVWVMLKRGGKKMTSIVYAH